MDYLAVFICFLKKKKICEEFFVELAKQKSVHHFLITALDGYLPPMCYVCNPFCWDETKRGRNFWYKIHIAWEKELYKNE